MDISSFLIGYQVGQKGSGGSGGSGGGSLPPGVYLQHCGITGPTGYRQAWFYLNGALYAQSLPTYGDGNKITTYKWDGSAWTQVIAQVTWNISSPSIKKCIEYNGKMHFLGSDRKEHYCWDGISADYTTLSLCPNYISSHFVHDGKLKAYSYADSNVYVWDETTDTWTVEANLGQSYTYYYFYVIGNDVIAAKFDSIFKYQNGTLTEVAKIPSASTYYGTDGNYLYVGSNPEKGNSVLWRYSPTDNSIVTVGKIFAGTDIEYLCTLGGKLAYYQDCASKNGNGAALYYVNVINEATE